MDIQAQVIVDCGKNSLNARGSSIYAKDKHNSISPDQGKEVSTILDVSNQLEQPEIDKMRTFPTVLVNESNGNLVSIDNAPIQDESNDITEKMVNKNMVTYQEANMIAYQEALRLHASSMDLPVSQIRSNKRLGELIIQKGRQLNKAALLSFQAANQRVQKSVELHQRYLRSRLQSRQREEALVKRNPDLPFRDVARKRADFLPARGAFCSKAVEANLPESLSDESKHEVWTDLGNQISNSNEPSAQRAEGSQGASPTRKNRSRLNNLLVLNSSSSRGVRDFGS